MFAKQLNGSAICTADYMDIKKGAIVPQSNELYAQVLENVEKNGWQDLPQPPEPTAEELAEIAKKTGEEYADTGITVPFSNEDSVGLLQVKAGFERGITNTVIHLSNGQKLPMSADGFPAFAAWFVKKRNAFFTS